MGYLHDRVYDSGLTVLDGEADALAICSAEPDTFAEANAAFRLGGKSAPAVSAPSARSGGGREVTVAAFADGAVTANGTATHWALLDTVNARLLAAGSLTATQVVTSGNSFSLTAFTVGIPGPG